MFSRYNRIVGLLYLLADALLALTSFGLAYLLRSSASTPRPPLPEEVQKCERWQRRRFRMVPGLTCLWALEGRNQLNFRRWRELDLEYIDNWSLTLDTKILLRTIPIVLLGRGAS